MCVCVCVGVKAHLNSFKPHLIFHVFYIINSGNRNNRGREKVVELLVAHK